MRRLLLPSALLLAAAGCNPSGASVACPAAPVARFDFSGSRTEAACAAGGPAAGANSLFPADVAFNAVISYVPGGVGAAVCPQNSRADPLLGTHGGTNGDHVDVSLETTGFVTGCGLCAAVFVQQVVGDVQRDLSGAPIGFVGTLTDTFTLDSTVAGADCTPCVTPCHGTYDLTTLPLSNK